MTARALRRSLGLLGCVALLGFGGTTVATAAPAPSTLSDALRAPRPKGGEYLGLYLSGKKIGYLYSDLALEPGHPDRARAITEFVFKATVGDRVAERRHREVRLYESRPHGRLLSIEVMDHGDGGDQSLRGVASPDALHVVRRRPGVAEEKLELPATRETIEDADEPRVALLRKEDLQGVTLDGAELVESKTHTTIGPSAVRLVAGVKLHLRKATTVSDKDKVPLEAWVADDGRIVEVQFGQSMRGQSEPKSIATRIDKVEIFALTRVVLPAPLGEDVREVPRTLKLVVTGLGPQFQKEGYRQHFTSLPGGKVEVRLSAVPPSPASVQLRPLTAPDAPESLKSSLIIESDAPAIRAKAAEVLGGEKNAYAAAQRIVLWVYRNMKKGYGTSSDRATDVLRQMKGDCTEHSLLTEALLRASGIPARRIDGLIYVVNEDGVPALYWHEWVEAYVGTWTQMDPTFGEIVADATHFAVGEESSAEITPLLGQLKVLQAQML